MNKLLRTNFIRLWKDRVFIVFSALMFLAGIALPMLHYMDNKSSQGEWSLDMGFFSYAIFIVILSSTFTSLFLGTEYSDGTIRNKIVVGHERGAIYLSNLIVCVVAGFIMCAVYLIPYLCIGIPLLGFFECGAKSIILFLLVVFAMMIAFVALFTLVAMICQNKAYTVATCILLAFLSLFVGIRIIAALNEPKYYDAYSYTENGVTISEAAEPNPNYLSGTKRDVYEFFEEFLPGGQAISLSGMTADNLEMMVLYDLMILVVATTGGIMLFKMKDLK